MRSQRANLQPLGRGGSLGLNIKLSADLIFVDLAEGVRYDPGFTEIWSLLMAEKFRKMFFPVWALCAFLVCGQSHAESSVIDLDIPDVVAKVNGVALDSGYVKFRLDLDSKNRPKKLTRSEMKKLATEIIDKEVVRELIYQEGKSGSSPVSPETIQKELERYIKTFKSAEEYEKALQGRNISEADLKKTIEVDILAKNLLDRQVKGKIQIEDAEVKQFFEAQKERFNRPESFRAQHIFIPYVPMEVLQNLSAEELSSKAEGYRSAAEEKIREIEAKVKAGEKFDELARTHSQDVGSAANGGDLDFIYLGVFDPAFDEAIAQLKIGEVSPVVGTRFGYHLIKLNERRPPEQATFEVMKEEVQKYLFMTKAQKLVGTYIEGLKDKAQIEYFYGAR